MFKPFRLLMLLFIGLATSEYLPLPAGLSLVGVADAQTYRARPSRNYRPRQNYGYRAPRQVNSYRGRNAYRPRHNYGYNAPRQINRYRGRNAYQRNLSATLNYHKNGNRWVPR
jgi:hypothetical protein